MSCGEFSSGFNSDCGDSRQERFIEKDIEYLVVYNKSKIIIPAGYRWFIVINLN